MDGVVAATAMSMVESSAESRRIYDVVIFGASGFTGKYVIREALKHLSVPSSPLKTIALAGRSKSKVSAALQWAASPSTPPSIPIIQADVLSRSSLVALCRQTRVLLNCVGPFQQYGEPVVSACVESGTDYLDITGEPDFMEKIEMEYHTKAVEAGCLVVSACGFDSIPAEIGVIFNSRQWVGASAPNKINAYLKVESEKGGVVGNIGTLASVVQGVASSKNLQRPQRSLPQRADPVIPGGLPEEAIIDHQKDVGVWAVKLPSADAIVVRRTLSILKENPTGLVGVEESEEDRMKRERFWSTVKPAHFSVKLSSKSLLGTVVHVIFGMLLLLFTSFSLGRWLILKYPEVFTFGSFRKTGPTEEEVLCTSFKMWFVGEGYSDVALAGQPGSQLDTQIITRISGPDLGYVTTPIALVQCALIMLGDRTKLPRGGAYPPGIVFGPSNQHKRTQPPKPPTTRITCASDRWTLSDGSPDNRKPTNSYTRSPHHTKKRLSDDDARRIIHAKAQYLSRLRRNQGPQAQTPRWIRRTPEQMARFLEDDRDGQLYGRHVLAAIRVVRSLASRREGTYDIREAMGSFVAKFTFKEMCVVLKEQRGWRQVRDFFGWMKLQLCYRPSVIAYTVVLRVYGQVGYYARSLRKLM